VATRKCINIWINKNPTILNMIGFRFILDARLLIAETVNNESYMSSKLYIRFKIISIVPNDYKRIVDIK
jgi:hypothetical protein